jgi:FkbM family methyltransferase
MIASILRKIIPAGLRPIRYLENLTRARTGGAVRQGPFIGMRYINRSVGSAFIPKLLGIYERELNEYIELSCALQFPLIVDIGAAEGYYAVGMARWNPGARVIAFEMEAHGRAALREMAGLNGVEVIEAGSREREAGGGNGRDQRSDQSWEQKSRVELHGKCEFGNLQATLASAARSLVICDVEGYEEILLVPEKIPALARATLLVEIHDCFRPGLTELIAERFAPTHHVQRIWAESRAQTDFPFTSIGTRLMPSRYLDWAVSEWRPTRMSWLWLRPKAAIVGKTRGNMAK